VISGDRLELVVRGSAFGARGDQPFN